MANQRRTPRLGVYPQKSGGTTVFHITVDGKPVCWKHTLGRLDEWAETDNRRLCNGCRLWLRDLVQLLPLVFIETVLPHLNEWWDRVATHFRCKNRA